MTTLAIMKARIADELARDDLTSQISYAISDAIEAYQDERFFFNESRALTFSTVASQEFYDGDDDANIPLVQKIDYVVFYIGTQPYHLMPMKPADIETSSASSSSTGQPGWFCWYGNQIRLYPIPDGAYTVRIGASYKVAAPASDDETDNPWMTDAARLIRSRAKLELSLHVLHDTDMANTVGQAVEEALEQLKSRTAQLTQVGEGCVAAMEF